MQLLFNNVNTFIVLFGTFVPPTCTFSLAGNMIAYIPVKLQTGKVTLIIRALKARWRLWWEINTFPPVSSLKGCVFPNFWQKMDEPNPSEMNVKVLIPAPIHCSQSQLFPWLGNWKELWNLSNRYWRNETIIWKRIMLFHANFITPKFVCIYLQKWRETSSVTSLLLIQSSSY